MDQFPQPCRELSAYLQYVLQRDDLQPRDTRHKSLVLSKPTQRKQGVVHMGSGAGAGSSPAHPNRRPCTHGRAVCRAHHLHSRTQAFK